MKKGWVRSIIIGSVIGILLGAGYVVAQDTNVWIGHMRFRQASPNVSFNGTLTFEKTDGTNLFQVSQSGANIGASGTNVGQLRFYGTGITPTAITGQGALDAGGRTVEEAMINITGIATTDQVFVNGPAPTAHCPLTGARASATDTVSFQFTVQTGDNCTPAAGFYRIWAIRT